MTSNRKSGILLHITSLPSIYGIGDLGPSAYDFVDFLIKTKQKIWQILPLNPTDPMAGANSPYSSCSAFAGNPILISPDLLFKEGYLTKSEIQNIPTFSDDGVDYQAVIKYKNKLFDSAYKRFKKNADGRDYQNFCSGNTHWLEDFALFVAIKEHYNGSVWSDWPDDIRDRNWDVLQNLRKNLFDRIEQVKFLQFIFFKQWIALKKHCNDRGIQIMGDIPIYVSYDSADVWTNSYVFKLDDQKKPTVVAGVPPDYFSKTGQLWGNPIYNWDQLRNSGYSWWKTRIGHNLYLYDIIRIDHFRGFVACWEIPTGEKTAINGQWINAPVVDFFTTLLNTYPNLPLIAEDLGLITPDVVEVMQRFNFPGMKVLQFAFDESCSTHPYAPHNHVKNSLVYTGTHDNNTTRGWFESEADSKAKTRLAAYLGHKVTSTQIHTDFLRMAMMSVAQLAICPLQDILGLGEKDRMNKPGTIVGNWEWRFKSQDLTPSISQMLLEMTEIYGRA